MNRPEFQGEQFEKGLQVRREVLGNEYVEPSLANADNLTAPLQKLVTEWCWGEVWTRPGLERKTRSLLNLAMLTALNRPHEVKIHARGALNNGVTEEEMVEVVLQAAIYCGVPAALDAMRCVTEVVRQMKEEQAVETAES
ncbi:carboxymuconolactone decarboxylase family protein [Oricola sp.]|uniref:carboxymuconolactone decarboxylase family protein n=1 Tax=Oricola sp. TaxID=1979950 RepID=UPI003BAAD57A